MSNYTRDLLSPSSLTEASTASDASSGLLITPTDELPGPPLYPHASHTPKYTDAFQNPRAVVRSDTVHTTTSALEALEEDIYRRRSRGYLEINSHRPTSHDISPHILSPPAATRYPRGLSNAPSPPPKESNQVGTNNHRRTKSTRELISMFETKDRDLLPSNNDAFSSSRRPPQYDHLRLPMLSPPGQRSQSKDHNRLALGSSNSMASSLNASVLSPSTSVSSVASGGTKIKNSFQSLLGVFSPAKRREKKRRKSMEEGGVQDGFVVDRKAVSLKSSSSRGVKTGHLAHLTSNRTSWTQCTAILDPPYLTLTPATGPSLSIQHQRLDASSPVTVTRLFDLSTCSETRSIGATRRDPGIPKPFIPTSGGTINENPDAVSEFDDGMEAHVFEIELDGDVKELFAAGSSKERGAWVSAIWDVILARKDLRESMSVDSVLETGSPVVDSDLQPPLRVVNSAASRMSGVFPVVSSYSPSGRTTSTTASPLSRPAPMAGFRHENPSDIVISTLSRPAAEGSQIAYRPTPPQSLPRFRASAPSAAPLLRPAPAHELQSPYTDITSPPHLSSLTTPPILGEDDDLTFPTPKPSVPAIPSFASRSDRDQGDDDFMGDRALRGVGLRDGDDRSESWRPSSGHTSPNEPIGSPMSSGVLSPFARRNTLRDLKKKNSVQGPSEQSVAISSIFQSTGTPVFPKPLPEAPAVTHFGLTPETRRIVIERPPLTLPPLNFGRDDSALDATFRPNAVADGPDSYDGPSVAQPSLRGNSKGHDDQWNTKLDDALSMLNELLHISSTNAHASSLATDNLDAKVDILTTQIRTSLSERPSLLGSAPAHLDDEGKQRHGIATYSNLPPSRTSAIASAAPRTDMSAEILECLDELSKRIPSDGRGYGALSDGRGGHPEQETLTGIQNILLRIDQLKAQQDVPSSPTQGSRIGSDLIGVEVHAKLDKLTELCQNLARGSRSQAVATQDDHSIGGFNNDVPVVPLGRSLSVFSGRGGRRNRILQDTADEVDTQDTPITSGADVPLQLLQVLTILQEERQARAAQGEQQASTARYLHELNEWLDRFVGKHATQMQEVASGVNQLLGTLGAGSDLATEHQDPDGRHGTPQARPQVLDVLSDVQQGITEIQQRSNGQDALNHSLHTLIQNLGAEVERLAHERQSLTSDVMMDMLRRQRHEHEQLVRGLATELATEIRGERIRFIDAMKEATTVNLQNQIHEFKEQLSKEVVGMEQELSDLFAMRYIIKAKGKAAPP